MDFKNFLLCFIISLTLFSGFALAIDGVIIEAPAVANGTGVSGNCPAGYAVQNISSVLECVAIGGGNFTETDPIWTANSSSVARIGNCPAGEVVQNTTTGGVQCVAASAGNSSFTQNLTDNLYLKLNQSTAQTMTASPIWNDRAANQLCFYDASKKLSGSSSLTINPSTLAITQSTSGGTTSTGASAFTANDFGYGADATAYTFTDDYSYLPGNAGYSHTVATFSGNLNTANQLNGMIGVKSSLSYAGSGTRTLGYGYQSYMSLSGSDTVENIYHYYAAGKSGTEPVTNAYGLYLESQKTTNVANGYGVYQTGTNDINFFAGLINASNIKSNVLTSGRVLYTGANKNITDSPMMLFNDATNVFSIGSDTTIGDVVSGSAFQTDEGGAPYTADGKYWAFTIYAKKDGVFSTTGYNVSFTDDSSTNTYHVDLDWDDVAGADGYRIIVVNDPVDGKYSDYSVDTVSSSMRYDDNRYNPGNPDMCSNSPALDCSTMDESTCGTYSAGCTTNMYDCSQWNGDQTNCEANSCTYDDPTCSGNYFISCSTEGSCASFTYGVDCPNGYGCADTPAVPPTVFSLLVDPKTSYASAMSQDFMITKELRIGAPTNTLTGASSDNITTDIAYFSNSVSATDFIDRTEVNTNPDVLSDFKSSDELLKADGTIDHTAYGDCYRSMNVTKLTGYENIVECSSKIFGVCLKSKVVGQTAKYETEFVDGVSMSCMNARQYHATDELIQEINKLKVSLECIKKAAGDSKAAELC